MSTHSPAPPAGECVKKRTKGVVYRFIVLNAENAGRPLRALVCRRTSAVIHNHAQKSPLEVFSRRRANDWGKETPRLAPL